MARERTPLAQGELDAFLAAHPHWKVVGGRLERTFALDTFKEAIGFVRKVARLADAADHHPDLDIRSREVTVRLFTHDAKALTARDTQLAGELELVFHAKRPEED